MINNRSILFRMIINNKIDTKKTGLLLFDAISLINS